jgi:hypothetical protein
VRWLGLLILVFFVRNHLAAFCQPLRKKIEIGLRTSSVS